MRDRYIERIDLFSVKDPELIAEQKLYELLMTEYPNWVELAKN